VNKIFQPGKIARPASGFVLTALVLLLSFAGASPQLHKLLHPDADSPDHNCAVTLFAHGQVDAASVSTVVVGIAVLFGGIALLAETLVLPLADYRYSPSRAPPVS
jgi:hypothetical protein